VTRPLRFCHLTTFYPPYSFGGDAMYIYRLSHALGDMGHQVDVIHCVDSYHLLHPAKPELEFPSHPNVTTHGLESGFKWLSPLLTQHSITELLSKTRYDVLHFHNISLLGPQIMTLDTGQDRIVKMYTTHEHWLICPTHVLWKLNKKPCDTPECLRCTIAASGLALYRFAREGQQTHRSIRLAQPLHREYARRKRL
jgi:hypothetical protein